MIRVIRQVEQRLVAAAKASTSGWEHLLNALYRVVEMLQIFALLTDPELKDQINQVAARFQEEDQAKELGLNCATAFAAFSNWAIFWPSRSMRCSESSGGRQLTAAFFNLKSQASSASCTHFRHHRPTNHVGRGFRDWLKTDIW